MNSDHRFTLLVALAGGLALGAAIAGGMRRTQHHAKRAQKDRQDHEVHSWEGEGGNIPSVPTPVPNPVLVNAGGG